MKPAEFQDFGAPARPCASSSARARSWRRWCGTCCCRTRRVRPRGPRLILLRHGEVVSHQGDQPLTLAGRQQARDAGRRLAGFGLGLGTPRSPAETRAPARRPRWWGRGLTGQGGGRGPEVAFALRNPDIYLAGARVDMVQLAAGVRRPGARAERRRRPGGGVLLGLVRCARPDRVVAAPPAPPGDDAPAVAARLAAFAGSLGDAGPGAPDTVIGVTPHPCCALSR